MFDQSFQTLRNALGSLWVNFLGHLPKLAIALMVVMLTALVVRLTNSGMSRILDRAQNLRPSLRKLFLKLARWTIWVVGLLVAAVIAFPGFNFAQLVATAGLTSVAIGFAFKDIFENFFAGILLLWSFPFEPGDFIEIEDEDIMGKVEDIQVRMTLLRKTTGELVLVPNATLYKKPVRILTNKNHRRIQLMVGVAYDVDVPKARSTLLDAIEGCSSVDTSKPIKVYAHSFGSSSVDFKVTWWTDSTPDDERRSRDEVIQTTKRALDDAGIEIPFPYRTLTFKEPLPIVSKTESEQAA